MHACQHQGTFYPVELPARNSDAKEKPAIMDTLASIIMCPICTSSVEDANIKRRFTAPLKLASMKVCLTCTIARKRCSGQEESTRSTKISPAQCFPNVISYKVLYVVSDLSTDNC